MLMVQILNKLPYNTCKHLKIIVLHSNVLSQPYFWLGRDRKLRVTVRLIDSQGMRLFIYKKTITSVPSHQCNEGKGEEGGMVQIQGIGLATLELLFKNKTYKKPSPAN